MAFQEVRSLYKLLKQYGAITVIDFETTGRDLKTLFPIQLSAVRLSAGIGEDGHMQWGEPETAAWYFKPPVSIPEPIVKMTGITDEFLADKPVVEDVFPEIENFLMGMPLAGYNSRRFDIPILKRLYEENGGLWIDFGEADVFRMAKEQVSPSEIPDYKQGTVAGHLLPEVEDDRLHNAEYDTVVCAELMKVFMRQYEEYLATREELIQPVVTKVSFWKNPRGKYDKIYAATDAGEFVFDVISKEWRKKDGLEGYDLEHVSDEACRIAGVSGTKELAKFRGTARA